MRKISFQCPCSIWWCWWLCATFPGSGCGGRAGRSKADLAWCRMALDVKWLHFCSYFIRLNSTHHWMQCTRTDLKSPIRKNTVFFSSLITVTQWISPQFSYSDKKSLTNGQFSISWNTSRGCILPGYGPPWAPGHSLLWREAAWLCSSQTWPGKGKSSPGAATGALSPSFFLAAAAHSTTMVWEPKCESTFCGTVPPKCQQEGLVFQRFCEFVVLTNAIVYIKHAACYPSNLAFHILHNMKLSIIRAQFIILFVMVVLLIKRLSQCSSASPLNPCQAWSTCKPCNFMENGNKAQCQLSVRSQAWAVHTALPGSCSPAPITWPELIFLLFLVSSLGHHNVYWWAFPDWKGQPGITLCGHH